MRDAPYQKQAWKRVNRLNKKLSVTYPDLAAWLEETIAHALAVFGLPASRRKRLRTTLGVERFQLRSHPIFLPRVILLQIEYKVM
jgi:transposase-like protein